MFRALMALIGSITLKLFNLKLLFTNFAYYAGGYVAATEPELVSEISYVGPAKLMREPCCSAGLGG
jgi:hypothetical protein